MKNTYFLSKFCIISFIITLIFISLSCSQQQTQIAENQVIMKPISPNWMPQQSGLDASLRGVMVLDETTAWISGSKGSYAFTHDAGKTWQNGIVPNADSLDFRDVHVFNKKNILLMSAGNGEKSRIYKTTDGGNNWSERYKMSFEKGFLCAMAFWNEKDGIAFSDPIDGKWLILLTNDSGKSWTQIDNSTFPKMYEGEYAFAASGTCITVFGENDVWIGSGGSVARIFYSPDRGKTWQVSDTEMMQGSSSQGVFSIVFSDSKTGFAVGGDYQNPENKISTFLETTDGIHWKLSKDDAEYSYRSSAVLFSHNNKKQLLTVGRNGSNIRFSDGNFMRFPEQKFYAAASSKNGKLIIAVGAEGAVSRLKLY